MIRLARFYWHRLRADTWRGRPGAAMAEARSQFVASRLHAQRAQRHDDRANALFPPPATGPPSGDASADGEHAAAQEHGP